MHLIIKREGKLILASPPKGRKPMAAAGRAVWDFRQQRFLLAIAAQKGGATCKQFSPWFRQMDEYEREAALAELIDKGWLEHTKETMMHERTFRITDAGYTCFALSGAGN